MSSSDKKPQWSIRAESSIINITVKRDSRKARRRPNNHLSFAAALTVLLSQTSVSSQTVCLFPVYSLDVGGLLVRGYDGGSYWTLTCPVRPDIIRQQTNNARKHFIKSAGRKTSGETGPRVPSQQENIVEKEKHLK